MAAGSSAAIAAAAAAVAAAARKKACEASVKGYQHDTATVQQAQSYADCIRTLHPSSWSPETGIAVKVAIVIVLFSMCVGLWRGLRTNEWDSRLESAAMGLVAWGLGSIVVLMVLSGIASAVRFLAV